MKKSATGKKSFSKIPVIALGPSQPGPEPVTLRVGFAKLTIDARGDLNPPPEQLDVTTGDSVGWLVVNNSDRNVKIRNKKFKKQNADLSPIAFLVERANVKKNGGTGLIYGIVTHLPPGTKDEIKYTVEVRGKRDADYDPDLIIRRPSV